MNRNVLKFGYLFFILSIVGVNVFAQDGDIVFRLPSARTAAAGGIHAAVTDDLSSLFANPAGFISAVAQDLGCGEVTKIVVTIG